MGLLECVSFLTFTWMTWYQWVMVWTSLFNLYFQLTSPALSSDPVSLVALCCPTTTTTCQPHTDLVSLSVFPQLLKSRSYQKECWYPKHVGNMDSNIYCMYIECRSAVRNIGMKYLLFSSFQKRNEFLCPYWKSGGHIALLLSIRMYVRLSVQTKFVQIDTR